MNSHKKSVGWSALQNGVIYFSLMAYLYGAIPLKAYAVGEEGGGTGEGVVQPAHRDVATQTDDTRLKKGILAKKLSYRLCQGGLGLASGAFVTLGVISNSAALSIFEGWRKSEVGVEGNDLSKEYTLMFVAIGALSFGAAKFSYDKVKEFGQKIKNERM